ncbi:hypothetical protein Ndes2526B_g03207 [Nannochloris sp. 'desiccata']|nr:hypothetical protein KSW81_006566 [Chlorella desiccata (nom. nud.)]
MHWIVLVGGQACHPGGQRVHRLSIESCPASSLEQTITESFETIYGIKQEYGPPLPEMGTWAFGFQVPEHKINKVMPLFQRRLERLEVCVYDEFYEDEPSGIALNTLSFDKCKSWLETITEYLLDSNDFSEKECPLYSFSDRPEGFSKPKVPVFNGENAWRWKHSKIASLIEKTDTPFINSNMSPKSPAAKVINPAGAAKQRHAATATANDGEAPSKHNTPRLLKQFPFDNTLNEQEKSEERTLVKIRAALHYAGYPGKVIEDIIGKSLQLSPRKKVRTCSWQLTLPNDVAVRSFMQIKNNPYPGGKVIENPLCEKAGCSRNFAHDGVCVINTKLAGTKRKSEEDRYVEPTSQKQPFGIASPVLPSGSRRANPILANDFTTSVVVECGAIEGIWHPSDPDVFKVTHGLLASKMPNGLIDGNAFERLGGKGHIKNWRFSIRVKLEDDLTMGLGAYMERNRASIKYPKLPSVEWTAMEVEAATAKKKEAVRLMLAQAHYPPAMIKILLEKARFKPETSPEGNLIIKFSINLPTGCSASSAEGILRNPYSLGGGLSGGRYALQGPGRSRSNQKDESEDVHEDSDAEEDEEAPHTSDEAFHICAATAHCLLQTGHVGRCKIAPLKSIMQPIKQEGKEVEKAGPQEECVIDLATTEEEDNVEEEGKEYRSSSSEEQR